MPSQRSLVWEKNHPEVNMYAGEYEGTSNITGKAMSSLLYGVEREEGGNDERGSELIGFKD
eukprot:12900698-Ditylum_brightwellii.AAC.1